MSPHKNQRFRVLSTLAMECLTQKKKYHKYFSFRERKDYFGEMLQFDGSYHHWFEDRLIDSGGYPIEVCLLASIDDATGTIEAKFDINESVFVVYS